MKYFGQTDVLLKSHLTVKRGRFVEPMLMLSLSFNCDQIYKYERYNFGHTFLAT
jgi:hypothetical protein